MVRENRLFLGNPGTGKSTLINCLVGQRVFESGITWGGGLTQEYQKYIVDDVTYMDTPGLADRSILKQAADAIKTALSEPGRYKLFFMVRLQAGRVVSDDLVTIERVLDSIDMDEIPFSILINNLGKRQYEVMAQLGKEFESVATLINSGKYKTPYIFFIPTFKDLEEQDNKVIKLPSEAVHFIQERAPAVFIRGGSVSDINVDSFEQQTRELRDQLEAMRQDSTRMMQMMMRLQERYHDAIEKEREYHRRNMQYMHQWHSLAQRQPRQKDKSCSIM